MGNNQSVIHNFTLVNINTLIHINLLVNKGEKSHAFHKDNNFYLIHAIIIGNKRSIIHITI